MSNKSSRSQSSDPSQKADDFRLINGLTKTAKAKLHAAGILTFDQLAMMSPHEIVAAIEDPNSASAETSAERIIRDDWIGQAKKLAESLKIAIEASPETSSAVATNKSEERITSFVLELKLSHNNTVKQTRVMHVESAETDAEKKWEGWNEAELLNFIAHRAGVVLPTALQGTKTVAQAPMAMPSIEERLRQLHAKTEPAAPAALPTLPQPTSSTVESANRPAKSEMKVFARGMNLPLGQVSSGEPYSLKVLLAPSLIPSPEASELTYSVTVYAKPLANRPDSAGKHHSSVIGETQGTIKPTDNLVFDVEGANLERGAYRLQAAAIFQSQAAKKSAQKRFTAFVEGGLLQVF
ncbi:MAG: hypothetical protein JNK38_27000 [Acidobacteria bacterium]|nr:hypothetical protein [Acidobacteriota bacterium]